MHGHGRGPRDQPPESRGRAREWETRGPPTQWENLESRAGTAEMTNWDGYAIVGLVLYALYANLAARDRHTITTLLRAIHSELLMARHDRDAP
jgi:hypothetical protein